MWRARFRECSRLQTLLTFKYFSYDNEELVSRLKSRLANSAGTNPTPRIRDPDHFAILGSGMDDLDLFCQRSGSFKDLGPSEDPDPHKDLNPRLLILGSSKVEIYTLGMIRL